MSNSKKFTKSQLKKIEDLNVDCCNEASGFHKDLQWGFEKGEIYAIYYFQSRDCDGDLGSSSTINRGITFNELLETIKNPSSKFNTRSWN